jgi:2-polyprenyl-6-hydroxyphenyl methylase/3-demethylubiquinone-9 3-methyltransferase
MSKYYSESLSARNLQKCYELAPPRIQRYLSEEIRVVRERINPEDLVLELGCGYGRALAELISGKNLLFGIDNSYDSIYFEKKSFLQSMKVFLLCMDVKKMGIHENKFDLVFCIQNGISALGIDPALVIHETLRVTKPGGIILLSSYTDNIWQDRLEWFQIQSEYGLIGEIDESRTENGIIICKDGFKATTFNKNQFNQLLSGFDKEYSIFEIDESSIFCEIIA